MFLFWISETEPVYWQRQQQQRMDAQASGHIAMGWLRRFDFKPLNFKRWYSPTKGRWC